MISTNEFFRKLDHGRKCISWSNAKRVNVRRLVKLLQSALEKTPLLHGIDLWNNPKTVTPRTDFEHHLAYDDFILILDYKKAYYVETCGSDYCQYIVELTNLYIEE